MKYPTDEIERSFFPLDRGTLKIAQGNWQECASTWEANGSIGSSEILIDETGMIVKAKRGDVAVEFVGD